MRDQWNIAHEKNCEHVNIDVDKWMDQKPFGFSACIRVYNDQDYLRASVESVIPYADEVILIPQPSDDDTVKICAELVLEYPEVVKSYLYPYNVFWIETPEFHELPINSVFHPVFMSNWGLSKCSFSHIIKMEADVILVEEGFRPLIDDVKRNPEADRALGFCIVNLAGKDHSLYAVDFPRNSGGDELIINNTIKWRFIRHQKWEMVNIFQDGFSCWGWVGYHMKRCKKIHHRGFRDEIWEDFTEANFRIAAENYAKSHGYYGRDDHSGEPWLFNVPEIERYDG